MISLKQLKAENKIVLKQSQVITGLNAIVKDIERCEKTMTDLQRELAEANSKHQGPRNTRDDISYLSALLGCARKKLAWEKQLASLQKRTPAILEQLTALLDDPSTPPPEQTRLEMLQALQKVQAAMERLKAAKVQ